MSNLIPRDEVDQQKRAARYSELVSRYSPRPPIGRNMALAFVVGGSICFIGQIFYNLFLELA